MKNEIITPERFNAILNSIPQDSDGMGFRRDEVYYSYAREKSGVYKGEPYTKPAHILINTGKKRFWIQWVDPTLRFMYDPSGGFNPVPITESDTLQELERHFSDLENHLHLIKRKQQPTTHTEPAINPQDLGDFIQTLLSWCTENQREEVEQAVKLALTSPEMYIKANRGQLALRGIDKPIQNLYVIALVEALQKIDIAAEVDWKAGYETIYWHISQLAKRHGINLQPVANTAELKTHEVLQKLGKDLASQSYVLTTININSDSYVLCVVPDTTYNKSVALAKKTVIKINRF